MKVLLCEIVDRDLSAHDVLSNGERVGDFLIRWFKKRWENDRRRKVKWSTKKKSTKKTNRVDDRQLVID
jgi:hypothetical protein